METRLSTGKGKYTQRKWGQFLAEAEERSKDKDLLIEYEIEFKKAIQDYARKNETELMESLECYRKAKSQDFERNYVSASGKKIKKILSCCEVMILTANPIEKAVLHHFVVEHEKREITRIIDGKNAYFVFKWGRYWIAHVHQGNIGSYTNMGSSATIHYALKHFTPNVIISLGVAF